MMIRSERQLGNARRRISELEESIADTSDKVTTDTLSALLQDLRTQISCYEKIKSGIVRVFDLDSLDDLGESIIKARLAQGMTQRELADALGVSEQMVQKDESNAYENGGIARLADILDILGYELIGSVRPKSDGRKVTFEDIQNSFFDVVEGTIPGTTAATSIRDVTFGPLPSRSYPMSNSTLVDFGPPGSASFGHIAFGAIRVFATRHLPFARNEWSQDKQ